MRFNVSLLNLLNSETKIKIIGFLLTHTAAMSEREIASILKVSHMSINRTMKELNEINFVNFVTIGKAHLWKVNRKSYSFDALSEIISALSNIKSPIKDLITTIKSTLSKAPVKKIAIFGSVANNTETLSSDIDLFILVKSAQERKNIESLIEKLSIVCLDRYGNRLAPYVLTDREMSQKKNLKIISEINKGLRLFP